MSGSNSLPNRFPSLAYERYTGRTFAAFLAGNNSIYVRHAATDISSWQPIPEDPVLLLHLGLVAVLMIIFPISKLLHAPGVFFSPSRNQVDNPREQRHIAPWAAELEK